MIKLQETTKYRTEDEASALNLIQEAKDGQNEGGYEVKKASYTIKTKKSKGEIVDVYAIVEICRAFNEE